MRCRRAEYQDLKTQLSLLQSYLFSYVWRDTIISSPQITGALIISSTNPSRFSKVAGLDLSSCIWPAKLFLQAELTRGD